ncbi:MAG TPA: DUF2752 domain-containing protein [Blastocatellia bacterium]|nr:DUF2752 domain-containing protein [Blastocatellia bacterium]
MEVDTVIASEGTTKNSGVFQAQVSKKLALFGFAGLFAVFLTSVLLRPPATDYFTLCGFKNLTGLPCPGCGLTHSFCALAKGDVGDAFGFNLLGPVLFLALVILWIRSAFVLLNVLSPVRAMDRIAGRLNLVRAFFIGFAVYGVVRIGYLLAYDSASFRGSPLSHLIGRLIH